MRLGRDSPIASAAAAQAQLITTDCLRSETQVSKIGSAQRQQLSGQLAGARRELVGFFSRTTAGIQRRIADQQAEVAVASGGILKSVQAAAAATLTAAEARSDQIRESIDGIVKTVSASVRSRVDGVATQITGLVDTLPLPDLPGVAQARAAAASLLKRAAGTVTSGLEQVVRFLGSALSSGMNLLTSFLGAFRQVVDSALSQAASTVRRIQQSIFQSLSRMTSLINSSLQSVLRSTVLPVIDRLERTILLNLSKAEEQTRDAIRANRSRYLNALTAAINPKAAGGEPGAATGSTKGLTPAEQLARVRQIGQEAIQNNRAIVAAFEERTSGTLGQIVQAVTSAAGQVVQRITGAVAQAVQLVTSKVAEAIAGLGQIARAVDTFLQSLIQVLVGALLEIVEYVRSLVQSPVDQLLRFAQGALTRVKELVAGLVRNFIGGLTGTASSASSQAQGFVLTSGPITKPRPPGTIVRPILEGLLLVFVVAAALVTYLFPGLAAAIISALAILGLTPIGEVIVLGVIAIVALLLLLLLAYLLFRWLFKPPPAPPGPPPKPGPEKITSETVATSPGARTRTDIGVGEEVLLTYSGGSTTWSTTGGTLDSTTGPQVKLTAPDDARAVIVVGGTATITFGVVAPSGVHMDRLSGVRHERNHADFGIFTLHFILPDTVNFSNVIFQEVDVGAVVSTPGAFDCFAGNDHCGKGGSGGCGDLLLTDTVVSGKGTQALPIAGGGTDCVYSGDCQKTPPFVPGTLSFTIPYEYKVGPGGTYRRFSSAFHLSGLASDGVTLIAEKAGVKAAIKVSDGTSTIPQC